jgi:DnaA family protein
VSRQLALNLKLRDASSFDNFLAARNREAVESVRAAIAAAADPTAGKLAAVFLWGEPGSGKTHLLEAACRAAQAGGLSPVYVSLAEARHLPVDLLEGMEQAVLVTLDDVQCIAGDPAWEAAIFGLYERQRAQGGALLAAASANPANLGLRLPDLATRLGADLVYQLHLLGDDDKVTALCRRAGSRGMQLTPEVARYVLAHYPRDLHALFQLLERIDQASLAAQRRITIPFVRSVAGTG